MFPLIVITFNVWREPISFWISSTKTLRSHNHYYTNIDLFLPRVRISDTFDSLFMVSFCVVSLWAFMCFVCLYKTPNERKQMTVRVFLYVCSIELNLLIFFVYFPQMGYFFYFLALKKGLLLLNKNAKHALRIYKFIHFLILNNLNCHILQFREVRAFNDFVFY